MGTKQNQTKKLLHWSSGTNLAWKLLCVGTCVTGLHAHQLLVKERLGGGAPPARSPWFPPSPAVQWGTFSISSSGMAGNWLFLWNEHDLEKHSAWSACVLQRVLSCTSHHKVFELPFIKAQLEPEDASVFQVNSNRSLARNHHNSRLAFLHGKSED